MDVLGVMRLRVTGEGCRQCGFPLWVGANRASTGMHVTRASAAAGGVTTGISAADRARTVKAAVRQDAKPEDSVQPGHIFPLMALTAREGP